MPVFIDLGRLSGRFLVSFGPQVGSQVEQKIDHMASCWQDGQNNKNLKKPKVFKVFGSLGLPTSNKIDKKALPGRSKIKPKIGPHLDLIFHRFWFQLGWILGGFWRPSWSHVGTKWLQNRSQETIKKNITFGEASGENFGG